MSDQPSKAPLDLIYSDVWRHSPITFVDDHRYYVHFLDVFSKFTWIFPVLNKSDVLPLFQNFTWISFIILWDCTLSFLPPYSWTKWGHRNETPTHNWSWTLFDGSQRSTISLLALFFWNCAHLINRLPAPTLANNTPFEKLIGCTPDYTTLRVFGCPRFSLLRPYNKHKLQYKSAQCIFLGYSPQHSGYRCLNPSTNKINISRHVVFDDEVFPFKLTAPPTRSSPHSSF